jgi:hypothetical protein
MHRPYFLTFRPAGCLKSRQNTGNAEARSVIPSLPNVSSAVNRPPAPRPCYIVRPCRWGMNGGFGCRGVAVRFTTDKLRACQCHPVLGRFPPIVLSPTHPGGQRKPFPGNRLPMSLRACFGDLFASFLRIHKMNYKPQRTTRKRRIASRR